MNSKCPCGSGVKYKKCCKPYHSGAKAPNALVLMKSRYSAYVVGDSNYIIKTTHKDNYDFRNDKKIWKSEIIGFCQNTDFYGLDILDFIDGADEAFVIFKASLSSGNMIEKSRFLRVDGSWLYLSGEIF